MIRELLKVKYNLASVPALYLADVVFSIESLCHFILVVLFSLMY